MTALWTDPAGKAHRVTIVDRGISTALIEYWDNEHRGSVWRRGRRYSHGTRRRTIVYLADLRVG